MPKGVIDGGGWLAARLKFLRQQLAAGDLDDDQRQAVEAEIEALAKERGLMPGGRRYPRLLRPLRRRR